MEIEEPNNYEVYDHHVNTIRAQLDELWKEFAGIRETKLGLTQKLSEQIHDVESLQQQVEQLLVSQKEKQDHWKRLETELYLLRKEVANAPKQDGHSE
ncbi:Uncharacterized protein QTN25_000084 [Entamoeba marina]